MALAREFLARILVVFALALGAVALGSWWASLLVARTAGTLSSINAAKVSREIASQLDQLAPGAGSLPQAEQAITSALRDPAVTQALASSVPGGSKALSAQLAQRDRVLAPILEKSPLNIDAGEHVLATLARRLRGIAKAAEIAAAGLGLAAIVISPLRHLILRHLGLGAGLVGGLGLLATWGLPALVGHLTHGGANHFASNVLSGGDPVRTALLESFLIGTAVFVATHLFELLGGRKFTGGGSSAPLPQGRAV